MLSITSIDSAKDLVSFLKKQVDVVIVSFHGGAEGAKYEHVIRANEIFTRKTGEMYMPFLMRS